ncbi:MAG: hypothetical protein AB2L14_32800 [Candidatus Xenobiia bacterium LiM19]
MRRFTILSAGALFIIIVFLVSAAAPSQAARPGSRVISQSVIDSTVAALIKDKGEKEAPRIRKGVQQVASTWVEEDGTPEIFTLFCRDQFMSEKDANEYLKRADCNFEYMIGLFQKMYICVNEPLQVENGLIMPADFLFSTVAPWAHLTDDFFQSKVAFAMLLNYPLFTLEEKMTLGEKWTQEEWAKERLAEMFNFHISAQAYQQASMAYSEADSYFNNYYVMMNNILTPEGKRLFSEGYRLSAHWGLKDELRNLYKDKDGLKKQELLAKVLERFNTSEIPKGVVNTSEVDWDPFSNKVFSGGKEVASVKDDNGRYLRYKKIFEATRVIDQYFPNYPTVLSRAFSLDLEIPEKEAEAHFISILTSPAVKKTAKLISKRLGRPLRPFDIWYGGFHSPNSLPEAKMNEIVSERYGSVEALNKNLAEILIKLGFSPEKARFISSRIVVEPSRGTGEAIGASLPQATVHMRIHLDRKGLSYHDYRKALYLLGQCVMQVLTNDSKGFAVMRATPGQAFTEAFALIFITRDLKSLDLDSQDPSTKNSETLNDLWSAYERSGSSLVSMKLWRWMYAHPEASPEEIRNAALSISKEVWNTYFASVLGEKDSTLLAVYSHLISPDLYIIQNSLGRIIQFQIETQIKGNGLAPEMERMCRIGKVTPDIWMKKAVGAPISTDALLKASEEAQRTMGGE